MHPTLTTDPAISAIPADPIIAAFRAQGFASLGQVLRDDDLARWQARFDHDRSRFADCWRVFTGTAGTTITTDPLVTSPEFDGLVRHPAILDAVRRVLDGDERFCEITLRHISAGAAGPSGAPSPDGWHRDFPHDPTHPLRIEAVQAMVYLSDVDQATHCFALSPEGAGEPILDTDGQLARGGVHECLGPAGTVVLFNASVLHTARVRGRVERKSAQTYYARRARELITNHSVVPSRLWDASANDEARAFYGARLGDRTRLFAAAFGR